MKEFSKQNFKKLKKNYKPTYPSLKTMNFSTKPINSWASTLKKPPPMTPSAKKSLSLKNTREWRKMRKSSMIGCPPKLKEGSETENPSTSIGSGSVVTGITSITKPTTMMITHPQKQSKATNSTYFTLIWKTRKKHLNIISRQLITQTTVWSNSKQDHPTKI